MKLTNTKNDFISWLEVSQPSIFSLLHYYPKTFSVISQIQELKNKQNEFLNQYQNCKKWSDENEKG